MLKTGPGQVVPLKGAQLKGEIGEDTADPTASHSYQ